MYVVLLCAALLALAACGGDGGSSGTNTTDSDDLVVDTQEAGGPDWVKSKADPEPGQVLTRFVEAGIAKDYRSMWNLLARGTRSQVAPTFAGFAKDVAPDLARSVGAFVTGKYRVVNSFRVGEGKAVASVAGDRKDPDSKKIEFETFGVALLRQQGEWKLELLTPISLTLVIPEERIALSKPRVAVSAEAGAPILEVGVWIDGKQYASPTEGASPTQMTIFAEADEKFPPGNHTVTAYSSIGETASATSWTFIVAD